LSLRNRGVFDRYRGVRETSTPNRISMGCQLVASALLRVEGWVTIPPRGDGGIIQEVGHGTAARWVTERAPLKPFPAAARPNPRGARAGLRRLQSDRDADSTLSPAPAPRGLGRAAAGKGAHDASGLHRKTGGPGDVCNCIDDIEPVRSSEALNSRPLNVGAQSPSDAV